MQNPRYIAAKALVKVEQKSSWSNLVLEGLFPKEMPARDRAFAHSLFYGALARLVTLDACVAAHSKTPVQKLDPAIRAILRGAVYQILYMDSVPNSAAVDEAVSLTKRMRKASAAGFVNAVLRSFLRAGKRIPLPEGPLEKRLSVQYSCDEALARLLIDFYGYEAAEGILADSVAEPPVFLRVNPLKTSADELLRILSGSGIQAEPDSELEYCLLSRAQGALHHLPAFCEGLFHIQDRSSQLCAEALGAKPGERVLDVCAAPGGKSFTVAQGMNNEGAVLCCDLHAHRTELIEKRAAELGIGILQTKTADMSEPVEGLGEYDRVLCDVPCSGYGTMRRKPEIKYKAPDNFAGLPELQYKILENSANYCKAGGRLVYSTCTLNPAENDAVVERFYAENKGFREISREIMLPGAGGGDGFFITVMERI